MRWICLSLLSAGLLFSAMVSDARAQRGAARGAVIGGASGAIIGGVARGGRGALVGGAIGAGTGAIIGDQMQRRRNNFYWSNNRCWQRSRNNEFFPVANRYCR